MGSPTGCEWFGIPAVFAGFRLWAYLVIASIVALAGVFVASRRREHEEYWPLKNWGLAAVAAVLAFALVAAACGGGGGSSSATPPGTYTLTFTSGAGNLNQSATVTLIVQ